MSSDELKRLAEQLDMYNLPSKYAQEVRDAATAISQRDAEIARLRAELGKRPPMSFTTKNGDKFKATFGGRGVVFEGDDGELRSSREFAFCPDGRMNDCWWVWDDVDQKWRPVDSCYSTREAAIAAKGAK